MSTTGIVLPHQLFAQQPLIAQAELIVLVEEPLLFTQFPIHRQKLAFQRAAMRAYADWLRQRGKQVRYIEFHEPEADLRQLVPYLAAQGTETILLHDPVDDWMERRLRRACSAGGLALRLLPSPMFLNSSEDLRSYFEGRSRMFQTDFYIHQRKSRRILLEGDGSPVGGKWTYDVDNRLRYPKDKVPPKLRFPEADAHWREAVAYVEGHFPNNPGDLRLDLCYPHTSERSADWLQTFLRERLADFGAYEDAIVAGASFLHHSVLTPMLNQGLLTPQQVIDATLDHAVQHPVPLNSLEGFLRQVMGWREYIRAVYLLRGREERVRNYWGFDRKLPAGFWNGQTGILPLDIVIQKVLRTGYCHHIERLMVLGNFMLLSEIDPDEVYVWFSALFIDAFDWVMVPNVYGMSQFADGGLMATKPYISGSNYLLKMSDFPKGPWQRTWDGLFWRFMHVHRDFFEQNPRLGMLVKTFDKMTPDIRRGHLEAAEGWIKRLDAAKF
ncbi:MAG: cryptochrome/photolyase family protein [Bacteroidia bacterium]